MRRAATAWLVAATWALTSSASAACPATVDALPVKALYGSWTARFEGVSAPATVQLAPHPDYPGVRGTIVRDGISAQLAGDIDDEGQLALDESQDGRSISAVWTGDMQAGACGKEFKGTWRNAIDDSTRPFVLSKTGELP